MCVCVCQNTLTLLMMLVMVMIERYGFSRCFPVLRRRLEEEQSRSSNAPRFL